VSAPSEAQAQAAMEANLRVATVPHIEGCSMWHHQGGDYDRDCATCMDLATVDQYLAAVGQPVHAPAGEVPVEQAGPIQPEGQIVAPQ
jgi:hypothetical protein